MSEQSKQYNWVQTHKEQIQYLSKMEGNQKELIELLKNAGVDDLTVTESPGKKVKLENIDPFTFFST